MLKKYSTLLILLILCSLNGCMFFEENEKDAEPADETIQKEYDFSNDESGNDFSNNDNDKVTDPSESINTNENNGCSVQEKKPAPEFNLRDIKGNLVGLSDLTGTPIILLFWNHDCHVCLIAMKSMEKLRQVDDVIKILAVTDSPKNIVEEYLKDHSINVTILLDPENSLFKNYNLSKTPAAVAIDRESNIEMVIEGFVNDETAKTLQRILRKWVIDRVVI